MNSSVLNVFYGDCFSMDNQGESCLIGWIALPDPLKEPRSRDLVGSSISCLARLLKLAGPDGIPILEEGFHGGLLQEATG